MKIESKKSMDCYIKSILPEHPYLDTNQEESILSKSILIRIRNFMFVENPKLLTILSENSPS